MSQNIDAQLSRNGAMQALAIGERLLSHDGEVSLFTSSEVGALAGSRSIAETAKIGGYIISSTLDKQSSRSNFEVDGKVEVIGLDEVGLPVYTEEDQERMIGFYDMVRLDPRNTPTYAVTERDSIMALLDRLKINNSGLDIQPGSITSLLDIPEISTVAITTVPKASDTDQGSRDILAA